MAVQGSPRSSIHLTITDAYAKTWGTWEGVREFVQNWYDGVLDSYETCSPAQSPMRKSLKIVPNGNAEFNAKVVMSAGNPKEDKDPTEITMGTLMYNKENQTLTLINYNTELQTKMLLLGFSEKRSHHDVIGQFGEGMKIGTLALLRNNHRVIVVTHNGLWKFSLEKHPQFEETVLTVNVEEKISHMSAVNPSSDITISEGDTYSQIWPIEESAWTGWVKRFLFLIPAADEVETELGSLLLDDTLKGQLYVKKIWVLDCNEKNKDKEKSKDVLSVGVNFKELEIDRDRRAVVHQSEIDHNVSCMWSRALKKRPDLAKFYYTMLEKGDHIVDTRLATYYLDDMQVTGMIADEFLKHYGENAVPIPNSSTADKLSYLHKELQEKVVLCNQTLIDILLRSGKVRRVEDIMVENTPQPVVGRVLLKNLQEDEFPVLIEAEHLIKMVEPNFDTSHISFYEGRDPNVTYVSPTQFEVPKWMLSSDYVHHQIACPAQSPQSVMLNIKCDISILRPTTLTLSPPEVHFWLH